MIFGSSNVKLNVYAMLTLVLLALTGNHCKNRKTLSAAARHIIIQPVAKCFLFLF